MTGEGRSRFGSKSIRKARALRRRTEGEGNQVWLSVKPSVLQKALVHLKIPAISERS
jgi:hypothetical protein